MWCDHFEHEGDAIAVPAAGSRCGYVGRLSRLLSITDIDLHIEEVTGADKSLDVVVDIFNRVNSGGTKLSRGDLALARICAEWPEGREAMKAELQRWAASGFHFDLDWLLRSVNTVLTGEAKFQYLHEQSAADVQDALKRATMRIDTSLNLISSRLGLDHDRVLFGRFGIPVMARYLDQRQQAKAGPMGERERDKLLFWFVQAAMWGRFSGSTEKSVHRPGSRGARGRWRSPGATARTAPPVAWQPARRAGALHWLEPGCAVLPCALSSDAHG